MRAMTNDVRRLDITLLDMDACIDASATLRALRQEYGAYEVQEPSWMHDRAIALARRIRDLKADQQAYRIAQIRGQLAQLQPIDEKRAALQKELTTIETAASA